MLVTWPSLLLTLFVAVSLSPGTLLSVRASHDPTGMYCASPVEEELLALINDFRAGRGLDSLGMSAPLGAAATHKSEEMASREYLSHVSPDGVAPRELISMHGYAHNTPIGENLAAGQESSEAVFKQWRDSPEHRELLLDKEFTAIGIGRAYNVEAPYDWYWAAEFGGVLAEPAESCDSGSDQPSASPVPSSQQTEDTPVRLICEGTRSPDGVYDLTCYEE